MPREPSGTLDHPIGLGPWQKSRDHREMRIAQVAPLYESCPPQLYGGTERVVSYLTEELVRQGHEVTLFASGDSQTAATLRAGCERALRLDSECRDDLSTLPSRKRSSQRTQRWRKRDSNPRSPVGSIMGA